MRLRIRTTDPIGTPGKHYATIHGQGMFVRVEDADTGELLGGVQAVRWELTDPTGIATATIKLVDVEVDLTVDPDHLTISRRSLSQDSAIGHLLTC